MRKRLVLICLLLSTAAIGQNKFDSLQRRSDEVWIYKISTAIAATYAKKEEIKIEQLDQQEPFRKYPFFSNYYDSLPAGNYVAVSIADRNVEAAFFTISNLFMYVLNNQKYPALLLRDKEGNLIANASLWINNKQVLFDKETLAYNVGKNYTKEVSVKVYALQDTAFFTLSPQDNLRYTIREQRRQHFKATRIYKIISWVPHKIGNLFKPSYAHRRYRPVKNIAGTATVIFNQPKYKPTDTVRFKAYIFDLDKKFYTKEVDVLLEYYAKGKSYSQLLTTLSPSSPGSYHYDFPLNDTLPNDTRYTISFKHNNKHINGNYFVTQDYLLDEVAKETFRSEKEKYYPGDSLRFFATATDANGLSVLDMKTRLVLTARNIKDFFKDSLYIADTLCDTEKKLLPEGETVYTIATSQFPFANVDIQAELSFINGNNEMHSKTVNVTYNRFDTAFITTQKNDSIYTSFLVNGKSVSASGYYIGNGDFSIKKAITYPATMKIDPAISRYQFYITAGDSNTDFSNSYVYEDYNLGFTMLNNGDTLGFSLDNPYKIPVLYTVFDGNKTIATGGGSTTIIQWQQRGLSTKKGYVVKWQYLWRNEEKQGEQRIGILHHKLNIAVENHTVIFPGQKDTIAIHVTDYKKRDAANTNVTAVSYNAQFSNSIRFPNLPNLATYKIKPQLLHDKYEMEDDNGLHFKRKFPIGNQPSWKAKLGVDSLTYYQYLFPANGYKDVVTPIQDFQPQVALHVVKNGEPQEIYMLYINRQLVYYNNVTEKMPYSYGTFAGHTQVAFRLYDRFIEIDSIYLQPHYKHDIIVDLDKLPSRTIVKEMADHFNYEEAGLLTNSIWRLDNNSKTNDGYVWQADRVVKLSGARRHIVGPFSAGDSLQFFSPRNFDIRFALEPNYVYTLSNKILRLEKMPLFDKPGDYKLPKLSRTDWTFGDTLIAPPAIEYPKPVVKTQLTLALSPISKYYVYGLDKGNLYFTKAKDTVISYIILIAKDASDTIIAPGTYRMLRINPGTYQLYFVDKRFKAIAFGDVAIRINTTLCIHTEKLPFKDNPVITMLATVVPTKETTQEKKETIPVVLQTPVAYQKGMAVIRGSVLDAKGRQPIAGTAITIKGTSTGTVTDAKGNFTIANIHEGRCTLIASMIGYESKQVSVIAGSITTNDITIELNLSEFHLNEVVVVGYGTTKKRSMTASISIDNALQGRLAGLALNNTDRRQDSVRIILRGLSSVTVDNNPLYVIDGILYDKMPSSIASGMISSMEILKEPAETSIYGSRGANGVILIKTKAKQQRTVFKDYAIWQPELLTGKDGKVKFVANYPDNITGWQTYIVGVDEKGRAGMSVTQIQSYKPVAAQLNMPSFLIERDSATIIGKALNYTADAYRISTAWKINGQTMQEKDPLLEAKSSLIYGYKLYAPAAPDSLKASFSLNTTTGFSDGEEKGIPVYQRGTAEADGNFYILQNDTTFQFSAKDKESSVALYAQKNTLDVLLNEIENIRKYPYYCMEQTASKLKGLQMLKTIKESLNEKFEDEKEVKQIISKLLKGQLFDGSWGWWDGGKPNLYISNYVISTLLYFRSSPEVEIAVRNGLLYLQNTLPKLQRQELLPVLLSMAKANHQMDYTPYIRQIPFDSVSQNNQWQYVQLKQLINAPYATELNYLLHKGITGVLGDLHWGEETYRWYNNSNATTQVAFEVLYKAKQYDKLNGIIQYFLAQRRNGYWRNTFESASICSATLPYILSHQQNFNAPARLSISGDTTFAITTFPQKINMPKGTQRLTVSKSGGGLTYLTLYEQYWNRTPEAVNNLFDIHTRFESKGRDIKVLTSGEKVKMTVTVNALKEAAFVMVEIPIPAGCVYSNRNQPDWFTHREYFKNKVVLFSELLSKGPHTYEIELETRYSGNYTLNPAKVSLMYFPTFYGRNAMDKVEIK